MHGITTGSLRARYAWAMRGQTISNAGHPGLCSRFGVPMGLPEILFAVLAVMLGGGAFVVVRFLWRLAFKR